MEHCVTIIQDFTTYCWSADPKKSCDSLILKFSCTFACFNYQAKPRGLSMFDCHFSAFKSHAFSMVKIR